jgi:pimeloyl-ACP methyl ester carboxylesterase
MRFTSFRRLLVAASVLAIFSGAAPASAAPASDKPAQPELTTLAPNGLPINNCVPESLRKHTVSFRTSDGVRISGLVLGSGKKGVVLEHEQGWRICSWLPFAQILASRGYHVMLLEARGTGASAATSEEDLHHLDLDFLAATEELTGRGATSILAGGASQGGTAAINSASRIPSLVGLVALSSPRDSDPFHGGMDALEAVKKITKPSFFAVSPGDMGTAFVVEVKGLYEASGATEKHYETVGGGIHGVGMMDSEEGGAELREKLLAFIDGAFRKAGVTDSPASQVAGTGAEVAAGGQTPASGQASASDERPWRPVTLTVGVAAVLLIGAASLIRRRRS